VISVYGGGLIVPDPTHFNVPNITLTPRSKNSGYAYERRRVPESLQTRSQAIVEFFESDEASRSIPNL